MIDGSIAALALAMSGAFVLYMTMLVATCWREAKKVTLTSPQEELPPVTLGVYRSLDESDQAPP